MPENKNKKSNFKLVSIITAFFVGLISFFSIPLFFLMSHTEKYGPAPTPFNRKLLKCFRIKGKVRSKSDNSPLKDLKIMLNAKGLETVTNNNGDFMFEIYNPEEKELKVEIPGTIPYFGTKSFDIKFDKISRHKTIEVQEASTEILL
ncbi:MAG: hypothetical protein ACD_59C00080G0002 [uncultured bacterium]|nr:MAG: hypothetical protein ACD_59C00080G0002 [uncultured bacterium]